VIVIQKIWKCKEFCVIKERPEKRRNMAKTAIAHTAAAALVARFRRQRPLRGGSLIVTIFGDSLLPRGGAIALRSLIDLAAPFGLNERLVRTAASRLVQEGWIEGRTSGKLSEYRLSKNGRGLFIEATKRIYGEPDSQWSGRWTLIVVPPMRAALRNEIRVELMWLGFGEISANVYAHPEFDSRALRGQRTLGGLLGKVVAFEALPAEEDAPQRLVEMGWDLDDLALRYQRFVARFAGVQAELTQRRNLDPEDCFMVRTLLIHEYRRLHLRDPLLPAQLLRRDWPGTRAAALCRDIYAKVFGPSELHLTRVASRLTGPLPAADASVMLRFGGIGPVLERRDDEA
jgi:phenylacetic acid degradation operon negative regulatory protein